MYLVRNSKEPILQHDVARPQTYATTVAIKKLKFTPFVKFHYIQLSLYPKEKSKDHLLYHGYLNREYNEVIDKIKEYWILFTKLNYLFTVERNHLKVIGTIATRN